MSRRARMLRRHTGTVDQNVDSLLDTMANVVGILVVLMAVTQMTVSHAMKRIQVWESEEAVELRRARQNAEAKMAGIGGFDLSQTLELSRLREHIRQLLEEPTTTAADTASISADVARRRLQVRRLEASISEKQEKLANLQILLAKAEARAEEEGIPLRLPDPRPPPLAAEPLMLFARYGRVFDPRYDQLTRELNDVIRQAPRPIPRYFEAYDIGNEMLRWQVIDKPRSRAYRLDWRHTRIGETADELRSPNAKLRQVYSSHDPSAKFLHFYVWGDSFEVYLEARRIAEEEGFEVGWEALSNGEPLELVRRKMSPTPVD